MKKEAFEAIFERDGDIPDTGPIEAHLHALGAEQRTPVVSLATCLGRIEEAAPPLCELLALAADGAALPREEQTLLFRGLHVLGAARIEQAWPDLLRLLSLPNEALDPWLGDTVTETLSQIAAGLFNGDTDSLFEAIGDRRRDEFVRSALWKTAAFLTLDGRIERERTCERLVWFFDDRRAADGDHAWVGWQGAIAELGLRELAPLVEKAFAQHRVADRVMALHHFEQDLAEAERAPGDPERLREARMVISKTSSSPSNGTTMATARGAARGAYRRSTPSATSAATTRAHAAAARKRRSVAWRPRAPGIGVGFVCYPLSDTPASTERAASRAGGGGAANRPHPSANGCGSSPDRNRITGFSS